MTAAFIVYVLLVTLPVVGAAVLTEKLLRLWKWPVRGAWAVAALAIVLIGGRAVVRQMTVAPTVLKLTPLTGATSVQRVDAGIVASIARVANDAMSFPRTAAAHLAHSIGPTNSRLLALLWMIASGVMLIFVCAVYVRVWYAARRWRVTDIAGHAVRVSPQTGPAVVGLFRPEIVVPDWMLRFDPADSALVLMHEAEHQRARDPLLLASMWALVALIPWHPGAWYCLARTRLAIELDCDARVVRRGASLRTYAELLLNQARMRLATPTQLWLGATSLLEPSSHLERRLNAMLPDNDPSVAPRRGARYLRTLSYLAVVSVIGVAACESHVPTAADISGLDAASAEKNAREASIISDKPVTFYVNNVKVSDDSAHAIDAKYISSVRVMKGDKAASSNGIWITVLDSANHVRMKDANADRGGAWKVADAGALGTPVPDGAPDQSVAPAKKKAPFAGAVTIDGVPSDLAAMNAIDPASIASIDVVKGPAALEQSTDPRAKNGLIRITLKH